MRKRAVIGVLALVLGVGILFVVWQPKQGSVDYHKRAYLKARDGSRMFNNLQADWCRISGIRPKFRPFETPATIAEMEKHERGLIKLGYMEERTFKAWIGGEGAVRAVFGEFSRNGTFRGNVLIERPIARIVGVGPDFIVVRGARQDMPKWAAVLAVGAATGQPESPNYE